MSFKTIAWAWEQSTGSPGRKAVLMAVAQFAGEDCGCWPSQRYIAKYTEQSERTVREHLARLEEDRFITRHTRSVAGNFTSDYIVINIRRQEPPAADFADGEKPPFPPADFAAKPVIEPVKKKKEAPAPQARVDFDFEAGIFLGLTVDQIGRLQAACPATDVDNEVLRAALWLVANPANRKSNYLRFLTNWMTRAQDKAGRVRTAGTPHESTRPRTVGDKRDEWTDAMFGASRARREQPTRPVELVEPVDLFPEPARGAGSH